ncbi:MAG TPA: D-aminoacyl-tRNA deacylase [Dehalococcoidia bacterium]|nr:D-aminoacyl-tRNA deacylase [Dehalococcoidia bacterium]
MRLVIQRVTEAAVTVDDRETGRIGAGLVIFVGVASGDTEDDAIRLARKTAHLRIFPAESGRFDRSLIDICGAALVISQFTLLADVRRGRRPYFGEAAAANEAEPLVRRYADSLRALGIEVAEGVFGAHMVVRLANDGPVTITLASEDLG